MKNEMFVRCHISKADSKQSHKLSRDWLPRAHPTIFTRCWAQNEKKKNDPRINQHFSFYFYIRQNRRGIWCIRKSWISLHASRQKCPFLAPVLSGKNVSISGQPHPISNIISSLSLSIPWLPLCTYLLWISVAFSTSSPPLFCSQSGSCLGPLGPGSYQLVMGPGGSGPRPWTQTDWLAGLISSLRTLCSLPSSACCCAVRARPDTEECG